MPVTMVLQIHWTLIWIFIRHLPAELVQWSGIIVEQAPVGGIDCIRVSYGTSSAAAWTYLAWGASS